MALYVIPVPDPPVGADWTYTVPGQYVEHIIGITATCTPGAGNPSFALDSSGNGFDGTYQNNTFHTLLYGQPGLVAGDTCVTNVSPRSNDPIAIAPTVIAPVTQGFAINLWASKLHATPAEGIFSTENDPPDGNNSSFTMLFTGGTTLTLELVWRSTLPASIQVTGPATQGVHMLTVEVDPGTGFGQFYLDGNPFGAAQALPVRPLPASQNTIRFGAAGDDTISYDEVSFVDGAPGAAFWAALYAKASVSFAAYSAFQLSNVPINYYHLDETSTVSQRAVMLEVTDGTHDVLGVPNGFAEAASSGPFAYSWQPNLNSSSQTPDGTITTVALPDLILPAGYTIGTNTPDLGAADQWSDIFIWWDSSYMDALDPLNAYVFPGGIRLVYQQERP